MNILFINANLHGHINPTLGLVKKLTEKGNTVNYFCSESFSKKVVQAGAIWIGYGKKLDPFLQSYRPTDRHPFYMLIEYILRYDEVVLPEILTLINDNKYDMIICDSIFGGGYFLQQLTKIPIVCSHSSFAMSRTPVPEQMLVKGFHPQLDLCYQIIERICERYKMKEPTIEQIFTSKGDLNIVYTTQSFNGDKGIHEPDYLFIGPSLDRNQEQSSLDLSMIGERKLLYISLGSFNTDFIDFYKMCMEAFRNTEYYVCMSIGKKFEIDQLGEIPDNFYVKSFLPQLDILRRADVFITHAGFNSVNEALYNGVPMLALPLVNDQHMVAKHIVTMRLGLMENMKELTVGTLREKTAELMSNSDIQENCRQFSMDMKQQVNTDQSIIKLEQFVAAWKERKENGSKE